MSGIYDDGARYGYGRDDRSSAREELFRRVAGSFVDEDRANKLIDDLLHEEAEKLRKTVKEAEGRGLNLSHQYVICLIDPYKGQ